MRQRFERRVLVVDDDERVREAYRTVLAPPPAADSELENARAALFDDQPPREQARGFELEFATQGPKAVEMMAAGLARGEGFAMAFLDMRMPPGWDGIRTAEELWKLDPELQIVICSAYSDVSWERLLQRLGRTDKLLILKKPFDPVEAQQMAEALCEKRVLTEHERARHSELEQLVAARTQELADALVLAESATRAKSEFLANMSHEIRTPLTAMLGFANLLGDQNLALAEREEYVATLRRNGEHLLSILNDVLDLSKLEAEQVLVESIPTDPCALLAEAASLMRVKAAEKRLGFEVVYDSELPEHIRSDPTRLRQIVLNLLGNAIKFTERGHVRLRVRLLDAHAPAPMLSIAVEDTGIGIAEEQRAGLFCAFQQVDGSTTRRFGGTGLGLLISKRLARLLGGDITVESQPGRGSTFTLQVATGTLEGVPLSRPTSEALRPSRPSKDADLPLLRGRILLVEDGRDNQRLITLVLRRAGAEVELAADGAEGCRRAEESRAGGRPYDLILMDMQMPEVDGYEATRRLRSAGWRGPIVALTAHSMAGDRERCIAAGCDAYESKPLNHERLLRLCSQLLAPAALPDSADASGCPRT